MWPSPVMVCGMRDWPIRFVLDVIRDAVAKLGRD
jgi:hypothetical protein